MNVVDEAYITMTGEYLKKGKKKNIKETVPRVRYPIPLVVLDRQQLSKLFTQCPLRMFRRKRSTAT